MISLHRHLRIVWHRVQWQVVRGFPWWLMQQDRILCCQQVQRFHQLRRQVRQSRLVISSKMNSEATDFSRRLDSRAKRNRTSWHRLATIPALSWFVEPWGLCLLKPMRSTSIVGGSQEFGMKKVPKIGTSGVRSNGMMHHGMLTIQGGKKRLTGKIGRRLGLKSLGKKRNGQSPNVMRCQSLRMRPIPKKFNTARLSP